MSVKLFKIYGNCIGSTFCLYVTSLNFTSCLFEDSLEIDEENKTDVKIIIARITCIFIVYILSAVPSKC